MKKSTNFLDFERVSLLRLCPENFVKKFILKKCVAFFSLNSWHEIKSKRGEK